MGKIAASERDAPGARLNDGPGSAEESGLAGRTPGLRRLPIRACEARIVA
jgi:hypothetical protein